MIEVVLIAHNLRSCYNVGSLLRTADGLGVTVYLTGYTPYPKSASDTRLPHITNKIDAQIHKTALGAENSTEWRQFDSIEKAIADLKNNGFTIAALEQTDTSQPLPDYRSPPKIAVLVGREVEGIEPDVVNLADICLEIPMYGNKESFNVAQAAAMALFQFRFVQQ